MGSAYTTIAADAISRYYVNLKIIYNEIKIIKEIER